MLRTAFLICLMALPLGAAPDASGTTEVDIEGARVLAFKLVATGHHREAAEIAVILAKRDPTDQAAWLALAQAQRGLGNHRAARTAAHRAWKYADTPEEKYAASLVASQGEAEAGRLTRAQLWLRRAAHHAPNPQMRSRAVQDFQTVRAANPWSTQLSFSINPSSNINNGAKSERVHGGTISGTALALSGMEYSGTVDLRYRFEGTERVQNWVGLNFQARAYSLSDAAKATAPTARNEDFSFQEAQLSFGSRIVNAKGDAAIDLRLDLGANRSGGQHLSNFATLTASRTHAISPLARISYGASLERIERQDTAIRSATVTTVFGAWSKALENGNQITLTASAGDSISRSSLVDHSRATLGFSYHWPDAPMNTSVDLSLSLEARNYHRPIGLFGMRDDKTASVGVTVTLKDREYYGFVPTIGLHAQTTASTVDIYDTETLGLRFGLRSAF